MGSEPVEARSSVRASANGGPVTVPERRLPFLATWLPGALAGIAGTAAMDLLQYAQYRAGGGTSGALKWEFASVEGWDGAPTPAQVGKRLFEGLFGTKLSEGSANTVNNVVHWGYGLAWATAFGAVAGSAASPRARWGPLFGSAVWLSGYAVLPLTGLYQPIWTYDARTLAKDWGGHLVYGTVVAFVFRLLSRKRK